MSSSRHRRNNTTRVYGQSSLVTPAWRKLLIATTVCLISLLSTNILKAQQWPASWQIWIDQWQTALDDETTLDLDELSEIYESLIDHPININDTNDPRLAQLPFVGNFRAHAVRAYIEQHGQILSFTELGLLNAFDATIIDLLKPVAIAAPYTKPYKPTLRQLLADGRSRLDLGAEQIVERAAGYNNGTFEGDPTHLFARYQFISSNHLHLSLSADKDAGEALFSQSQPQGFDFYSGYLMLSDISIISKAVIGHYNMQIGQGLTLWTGFAPFGTAQADDSRYGRGITSASPFSEYGHLQGAATTLKLSRNIELTGFYSNVARDATKSDGIIRSLSNSGYHRSASEIAHKDLLREQLYGANITYTTHNMTVGLTACHTLLSDSLQPNSYKYNYYTFNGDKAFNAGIDARMRISRLLLYGEASITGSGALAAIAGGTFALSPDRQIGISLHSYSAEYYNLHHAARTHTSVAGGEQGLRVAYQTQLPFAINAILEADAYHLTTLRYRLYAPSNGAIIRISLSRQMSSHSTVSLGYTERCSQRNRTADSLIEYRIENIARRQFSIDYHLEINQLLLRTHAAAVLHSTENADNQGYIVFQDVGFTSPHSKFTLTGRALLFNTTNYDARISTIESSLAYQLSSATLYGRGLRFYAIMRYDISRALRLAARYSITIYPSAESIGSGVNQIDGNHRQQWQLQATLRF